MRITVWRGDIAEAPADAVCTSTNPRLSLMMGTGASVRERGGFAILRACEGIMAAFSERTGRHALPVGSVHVTESGSLPYRGIIHCVACDESHRSSAAIVRVLVVNALRAADSLGCRTLAMPVFATGHARVPFRDALLAILDALRSAETGVEETLLVSNDQERLDMLRLLISPQGEPSRS